MLNKADGVFFSDPDSAVEKKTEEKPQDEPPKSEKTDGKKKKNAKSPVEKGMTEKEKQEKIRAVHNKRFMSYPTNSGISGQVFKSTKLYFSNNASKESKFVEEIDDQSLSGYPVKNFMIGPVFGASEPNVPCAII